MLKHHFLSSRGPAARLVPAIAALLTIALMAGCGGGGGAASTSTAPPVPAGSSAAQVRIGDAPVDSVISFEVTVGSLSLTPSNGGAAVNIAVPASNRLELSHESGKFEPFLTGSLPQGSFTSASLTLTNSELTFLSSTGTPVHINGPASASVTVPLSPALTVGTSPLVLNIDANIANSVTTNASNVITGISFGSNSFSITAKAPGAATEQDDDGEIEDVRGLVTAASSSNFTLKSGQSGGSLIFNFDATTQFSDGATSTNLLNQIVKVEGFTRSDGSLFAKEVEGLESSTGSELEGLITSISGTLLTVNADDGIGGGMDDTKIGASFTVSISGLNASKFKVDGGNGLGTSVPNTLTFDNTTIHQGQRIEVESTSAVPAPGGTITAEKIKLKQQGVSGTVANLVANGNFDLNLAADSHLAVISGQTVVHVTKVSSTDVRKTVANAGSAQVRGLLFWNGTSWQMIARRIR
ncbi:MAG: DUF5666 domain-containing protein [Acidobacteriia bacterium]|nr:DUF5666 domain-containing protein [Terriglobia bacterium]